MSIPDQICENLGFTLEGVQESHERVNEYVATLYLEEPIRTTLELPGGEKLYRHQLVTGPGGSHYIALNLGDETIELAAVDQPLPGENIKFIEYTTLTYGEFLMEFEPQFAEDGQPVWCY